jgi:hypothetical protein
MMVGKYVDVDDDVDDMEASVAQMEREERQRCVMMVCVY